jgi:hypothetical protein
MLVLTPVQMLTLAVAYLCKLCPLGIGGIQLAAELLNLLLLCCQSVCKCCQIIKVLSAGCSTSSCLSSSCSASTIR